jgi:hypothetical protein
MMFFGKRAEPIRLPPPPYVVQHSGTFDGNDGKWSTFNINVGDDGNNNNNGQNFRVLISTSSPNTLIPGQTDWCNTEDCAKSRGIGFYDGKQALGLQKSPQWMDAGIYEIPLPNWWIDPLSPNESSNNTGATWGQDNVGLGTSSPTSPILAEQYVIRYLVGDFFMGSFGLAAGNSGPPGGDKPNFLDNLYDSAQMIASRSYGYTAGAHYRKCSSPTIPSLTLLYSAHPLPK